MATLVPPMPNAACKATTPEAVGRARQAQQMWAMTSLRQRLAIIRSARHLIAERCRDLAGAIPSAENPVDVPEEGARSIRDVRAAYPMLARTLADSLIAEVLPLAEACRFLEQQAATILRPIKLGRKGRPFWLGNLAAEVHRAPLGLVLIIAPSNYPLFLPGVQALQALVAGNAVLWKPAVGYSRPAQKLEGVLEDAGLPPGVLQVLDDSVDSAAEAMRAAVDKVFLTGHQNTGRSVLRQLSETGTPSVMELSGCDAVFVLPGADLERLSHALAFGLRLNGSATCMAPRRIFAPASMCDRILALLLPMLTAASPVGLAPKIRGIVDSLVQDAQRLGASVVLDGRRGRADQVTPIILAGVSPDAEVLRTDIFAPLLSFCPVSTKEEAAAANARCPYALTAAVFGSADEAHSLAANLDVGTVLINDIIVSTADPRTPFGGRRGSGFGVTRGREGLLEMTAIKTILHQKGNSLRPYAATTARHDPFFASYIQAVHSGSLVKRFKAFRRLLHEAKTVEN